MMPDKRPNEEEGLSDRLTTQQIERLSALATARLSVVEDTLEEVRGLRKDTNQLIETVRKSYATRKEIDETRSTAVFFIMLVVVIIFQMYLAGFLRYCADTVIPGYNEVACHMVFPVLTPNGGWPSLYNVLGAIVYVVVFALGWAVLHKRSG